jgi:hypothetical protein
MIGFRTNRKPLEIAIAPEVAEPFRGKMSEYEKGQQEFLRALPDLPGAGGGT